MPVHYDIAAAEAAFREQLREIRADGDKHLADGTARASFVAAQREFDEARLAFFISGLRALNAGLPPEDISAAAGVAIGLMLGSTISSTASVEEAVAVSQWVEKAAQDVVNALGDGDTDPQENRSTVGVIAINPEEAGHG